MAAWNEAEAGAQLDKICDLAETEGPQEILRNGTVVAVLFVPCAVPTTLLSVE